MYVHDIECDFKFVFHIWKFVLPKFLISVTSNNNKNPTQQEKNTAYKNI